MVIKCKKWVLFNILKVKAHFLRLKHFIITGKDIEKLPSPQEGYCRAYFFEIEGDSYVLKHHEIPLFLIEKFYEDFNNKNGKLMGLKREEVVRWVLENKN
jgi:hypothetical protein